jgi:serine phosphatase RsbU (regulator of sigma subunit)
MKIPIIKKSVKAKFILVFTILFIMILLFYSLIFIRNQQRTLIHLAYDKCYFFIEGFSTNILSLKETTNKLIILDIIDGIKKESHLSERFQDIRLIQIFDKSGTVLISNIREYEEKKVDSKNFGKIKFDNREKIYEFETKVNNEHILEFFKYLGKFNIDGTGAKDLMLRMSFSIEPIYHTIRNERLGIILLGIIMLSLGIAGNFGIINTFLKPIDILIDYTKQIAKGKLNLRYDMIKTEDEFGKLNDAFATMTRDLRIAQNEIVIKNRMEKELEIAKRIQSALFPKKLPEIPTIDIAPCYQFAREIGGDYYDIMPLNGKLIVVVGDVSGKGIPASLIMVMFRSILRTEIMSEPDSIKLIKKVNDIIMEDIQAGQFITFLFTCVNLESSTLEIINAGHLPLLFYRSSTNKILKINPTGIGLGLDKGKIFLDNLKRIKIKYNKNDVALLYTDGITEAMNYELEEYAEERLIDAFMHSCNLNSNDIINYIKNDLNKFIGNKEFEDDFTMVALKFI